MSIIEEGYGGEKCAQLACDCCHVTIMKGFRKMKQSAVVQRLLLSALLVCTVWI